MRELKDYFCNFKQENELFKLGFDTSQKIYIKHDVLRYVILCSQALDYFRELGYNAKVNQSKNGCWHEIEKGNILITEGGFWHYYNSESALIDKLIELEKEARNEK